MQILTCSQVLFNHENFLNSYKNPGTASSVDWGYRIHQLHLCRGVRPSPIDCPGYDIKPSDGAAPVLKFGEYSVPIHCHCIKVLSDPEG